MGVPVGVPVRADRGLDVLVAQLLLDKVDRLAGGEPQRGGGVPQVVHAQLRVQAGGVERRPVAVLPDAGVAQVRSLPGGEDERRQDPVVALPVALVVEDPEHERVDEDGPRPVVSEQTYAVELERLARTCERRNDIRIIAALYDDDLKAALAAADLFVLPSINENFGNAAAEAVAAGVPVLLTDTCGIASMIHRRAGLAVPLGIEPLSQGLKTMLGAKRRAELTARREEVKRDLSWDEPIKQAEELYERVIAESKL